MQYTTLGLISLGFSLGLRHGIDWDHIAAITDISGSTVTGDEAATCSGSGRTRSARHAFWLVTLYALGHALMVVGLGLLAIWASEILPAWLDPLMERVVGVTLVFLGIYVFYSLWRYGASFRMQSRWMLLLSIIGKAWAALKSKITGRTAHSHDLSQYGQGTAFGIGLIHGLGAETGSQALLLASVAGVTSRSTGSLLLVCFTVGLLVSNSLVAAFALAGFVSSVTKRKVYSGVSLCVGIFSLFVGVYFVAGRGDSLPDLQKTMSRLVGPVRGQDDAPTSSVRS